MQKEVNIVFIEVNLPLTCFSEGDISAVVFRFKLSSFALSIDMSCSLSVDSGVK